MASLLAASVLTSSLLAQDDANPPDFKAADTPPGIVLLLKEPLALDAVAWRKSWSEIVPLVGDAPHEENPWVKAEGETLVGVRDGVSFVVRAVAKPRQLADWQVRHLFAEERAELRTNGAAVEVVFVGKTPVGEPRHDAYRALASIAAALPKSAACVGLGIVDHGTFDAFTSPLILTRFKDPLNAMEPESILRLFAAKRSALDMPAVMAALGKEFGTTFTRGYGKPDTIDGSEHYLTAQVGELYVSIHWSDKMDVARAGLGSNADPAVRQLLRRHKSVLAIRATGPAGERAEAARHRVLARIGAALWSEDFLGLNWRCSSVVVPVDASTPELLRRENPVAATIGAAKPGAAGK